MGIFEAAKTAKQFVTDSVANTTTVQKTGVVAVQNNEVLVFKNVSQACHSAPDSFVFSYIYRNGQVEVTPEN